MIITVRKDISADAGRLLLKRLEESGVKIKTVESDFHTVLVLTGDTALVDEGLISSLEGVVKVERLSVPYTAGSREYHREKTVIEIKCGNDTVRLGEGLTFIAGPCALESEKSAVETAKAVKSAGASVFRGGAFKPRTSPYSFSGLREEGLKILSAVKKECGIPVISEIMDPRHLELFEDVDILQIGARNMQNFELLREIGRCRKPVMLKRSPGGTLNDLLMSAEYILSEGNENVILCERGIRTFENTTRNTFDVSAIPSLLSSSHLPVAADPSHAVGLSALVPPMMYASAAAGADIIMTEVHPDPAAALCDGRQAITPEIFEKAVCKCRKIRESIDG